MGGKKTVKKIVHTEKGRKEVFSGDNKHINQNAAGIITSMNNNSIESSVDDIERKLGKFELESVAEALSIDIDKAKEEFNEWLKQDHSAISKGRIFFRDVVLLKVFRYSGTYEFAKIISSEMSRTGYRSEKKKSAGIFFPIAKVLSVGAGTEDYGLEQGDIVELSDSIMGIVPNPAFDSWLEEKAGSVGGGIVGMDDAPPRFARGDNELEQWVFNVDKFSQEEDPTVVLVPKVMIKSKATDVYLG